MKKIAEWRECDICRKRETNKRRNLNYNIVFLFPEEIKNKLKSMFKRFSDFIDICDSCLLSVIEETQKIIKVENVTTK